MSGDLASGVDGIVVGLADDPDAQTRRVVRWRPRSGGLAVVGSIGSGTTSTLRTVAVAAGGWRATNGIWVHGFDQDGGLEGLEALPHVGAVVRGHDVERRARLARLLDTELDERRRIGSGHGRPTILVLVDPVSSVLAAFDDGADPAGAAAIRRVLIEGAGHGIVAVLAAERPGSIPTALSASIAERIVLHLVDPMDSAGMGLRPDRRPVALPGRGVHVPSGLAVQVAVADPARVSAGGGPAAMRASAGSASVGVSDPAVAASGTPEPPTVSALAEVVWWGSDLAAAALETESLEPVAIAVDPGAPVLVAGPSRSGVSSALTTIAAAWRLAPEGGPVAGPAPLRRVVGVCAGPARSLTGEAFDAVVGPAEAEASIATGPSADVLVVIDDAHLLVADPALDRLVASTPRVVLGGRADRLLGAPTPWGRAVRTAGTAVLLTPRDRDGDAFGVRLPRRFVPDRPGRGVVIRAGEVRAVQMARVAGGGDVETVGRDSEPPANRTTSRGIEE